MGIRDGELWFGFNRLIGRSVITTQNRLEIASQGSVLVLMNHVSGLITLSRSFSCLIISCIVDLPWSVLWGVGIRSTPFYLIGCTVLVSVTIGRYTSLKLAGAIHGTVGSQKNRSTLLFSLPRLLRTFFGFSSYNFKNGSLHATQAKSPENTYNTSPGKPYLYHHQKRHG